MGTRVFSTFLFSANCMHSFKTGLNHNKIDTKKNHTEVT